MTAFFLVHYNQYTKTFRADSIAGMSGARANTKLKGDITTSQLL